MNAAEFYDALAGEHGATPKALALASRSSQYLRFSTLLETVPVAHDDAIFDVGCGFADLGDYLHVLGHGGRYVGWDVSGRLLAAAREQCGPRPWTLQRRDVHTASLAEVCPDWVVCAGTFNIGCTEDQAWETIVRLFGAARKGIFVALQNARGTHGDAPDDGTLRVKFDPSHVYERAKALTPWVALRDDYLPHDVAVAMMKRPRWELAAGVRRVRPG